MSSCRSSKFKSNSGLRHDLEAFHCITQTSTYLLNAVYSKSISMWLPPNNTFIQQCNLFPYHKYISKHSSVCCQATGIILMRNINGRCPENMLVLVSIASSQWLLSFYLTFVEDDSINHSTYVVRLRTTAISLDHWDLKSCFTDLTLLIKMTNRYKRTHSCSVDMITSQINSFIAPKRRFSWVFFLQIPGLGGISFKFPVFPVSR